MVMILVLYTQEVYILKCNVHFSSSGTVAGLLLRFVASKKFSKFMMSLIDFSLNKKFHLKVIKKNK